MTLLKEVNCWVGTPKALLKHNQNVNMFDTRLLNEDISQSDKPFTKRNGKLRNVAKYILQSNSNCQIQYYELNTYIQNTSMASFNHSC